MYGTRTFKMGVFSALIILAMGSIFLVHGKGNICQDDRPYSKYYTSIEVKDGDTLTKIADRYMCGEYGSADEYIDEVCFMNHILDPSEIYKGAYLAIPYYVDP